MYKSKTSAGSSKKGKSSSMKKTMKPKAMKGKKGMK